LKPGDKILGFDLSHGGHNTRFPVNFSGRLYTPSFYGERETGRLDYDKIQEIALKNSRK
jgi:glycine hydroxymethyltransferase